MRVLLSAYACSPWSGSDNAVAWGWATQLARLGIEVWVITREINRFDIERWINETGGMPNLHFIYYEHPVLIKVLRRLRAKFRYFYYYIWQWQAYKLAAELHKQIRFDVVHHVTWVQVRSPSFMGRLGIPFILGPLGGGVLTPFRLRNAYGFKQWIIDLLRDIWTLLAAIDPFVRQTFKTAARIIVASAETMRFIPEKERRKTNVQLPIVYTPSLEKEQEQDIGGEKTGYGINLLYAGRFLEWKGMTLGLAAFSHLLKTYPEAHLTMVGSGPAEKRWKKCADRLRLDGKIDWICRVPRIQVEAMYANYDILLFPSLHDTASFVVLEALSHGLPVVCLDLGGPGFIVDKTCGIVVKTAGRSRREVELALGEALITLAQDRDRLQQLRAGARHRAGSFTWEKLIQGCYDGLLPQHFMKRLCPELLTEESTNPD